MATEKAMVVMILQSKNIRYKRRHIKGGLYTLEIKRMKQLIKKENAGRKRLVP